MYLTYLATIYIYIYIYIYVYVCVCVCVCFLSVSKFINPENRNSNIHRNAEKMLFLFVAKPDLEMLDTTRGNRRISALQKLQGFWLHFSSLLHQQSGNVTVTKSGSNMSRQMQNNRPEFLFPYYDFRINLLKFFMYQNAECLLYVAWCQQ